MNKPTNHPLIPPIIGILHSQTYISRKWNDGCQGRGGVENGEMFSGYKVTVTQNE